MQNKNKKFAPNKKPFNKGRRKKSGKSPNFRGRQVPEQYQGTLTLNWFAAAYHRISKVVVQHTPKGLMVLDGVYPPPGRVTDPSYGSFQTKVKNKVGIQILTLMTCPAGTFWSALDTREAWFSTCSGVVEKIRGDKKNVVITTSSGPMTFPRFTNNRWSDTFLRKGDQVKEGQIIGGPKSAPRMYRPRIISIPAFHRKKLEMITGMDWEPDERELDKMYDRMSLSAFHAQTRSRNEEVMDRAVYRQGTWQGLREMYQVDTREFERKTELEGAQPYAAEMANTVIEGMLDHAAEVEGGLHEEVGTPPEILRPEDFGMGEPKYTSFARLSKKPADKPKERPPHVTHSRIMVS